MSLPSTSKYAPPPGLPPGYPRLVQFPFIHQDQLPTLYSQGYARVHLPPHHPLLSAATSLLATSRDFFAKEGAHKQQFHISNLQDPNNKAHQSSDEGWSSVEGEKEILTIRRSLPLLCPPEVAPDARALWSECGVYMQSAMRAVESSLGLQAGAFENVMEGECVLPAEERHETMMRMFRYERGGSGEEPRLVAAQHRDIGLLSLVVGSSPGLEAWDARTQRWVAVEEAEEGEREGGLTITLLVGMTLTRLTNNLYKPGLHRVFVPPAPTGDRGGGNDEDDAKHRYSIVFALRPYRDAVISTGALTSAVTGPFRYPLEGVRAQTLFNAIANAHWDINIGVDEREAQRARLKEQGVVMD